MPVVQVTIFISLILAATFIVCFAMEAWRNKNQGVEQTSLLPLLDDDGEVDEDESDKTSKSITPNTSATEDKHT